MKQNLIVSSVVAGVIALIVTLTGGTTTVVKNLGSLTGPNINSPWLCVGGICTWHVVGSCSTASSTIFSNQNPWSATSTVSNFVIYGQVSATTTDIMVGTSTSMSAPGNPVTATTSISAAFFGMSNLTGGSQFFSQAGVTVGPNGNYAKPNTGAYPTSNASVVIGPSEYIIGFATSTNLTNGNSATNIIVPASCSYSYTVRRGTN